MARKTIDYTVDSEGRDQGKIFRITELPAFRAEKWAIRAFQALAKTGVQLPDNLNDAPLAKFAEMGLEALAKVPFDDLEPLLDEMMTCVKIVPDVARSNVVRDLIESDIEEPTTVMVLRREVLTLHIGFFMGG